MKIREGNSSFGNIVYTFDGKRIREGKSSFGDIVYTLEY